MNRYEYLIKNIGLLTLSRFATKLIGFFLVPLYTNVLTTSEYGTYDLFSTTINVLIPILTLNVQEAVLRFALDKKYSRNAIATVGAKYLLYSCGIVLAFTVLASSGLLGFFQIGIEYAAIFFIMYAVQTLSELLVAYVRGADKIAELSVSSVVATVVTVGCNVLFLVYFRWGLMGYFLANILGPLSQCIYLAVSSHVASNIKFSAPFSEEKKEMLNYSRPMIANSIAWWVNNVSDRYVVIFFCGIAANGIYSVASKIPSILNIFQSVFNQAWALSAVKDYDPEDKSGFFSNTYNAYNCFLVVLCSALILSDKILSRFLYAKEFYEAWKYVPWLTIAILFGGLAGYIGGLFAAKKNSKIYAQSTMAGALSNILMNLVFTPLMGPLGAAIATAICYFIVWGIRYWNSKKFIHMKINIYRDLFSYALLAVQSVVLLVISENVLLYGIEIALLLFIVLLYANDIIQILKRIYITFANRKNVRPEM